MAPICGVCETQESKYKCPVCALRYCSIPCYKTHRTEHDSEPQPQQTQPIQQPTPTTSTISAPPSTLRTTNKSTPQQSRFSNFENDPALPTLLQRYPLLRIQLQTIYALTLDPGPDGERPPKHQDSSRGGRGGGHSRGGGIERKSRSRWTREKGDREALDTLRRMARISGSGSQDAIGNGRGRETELAEGMREFFDLCKMRFENGDGEGAK